MGAFLCAAAACPTACISETSTADDEHPPWPGAATPVQIPEAPAPEFIPETPPPDLIGGDEPAPEPPPLGSLVAYKTHKEGELHVACSWWAKPPDRNWCVRAVAKYGKKSRAV